MTTSTLRRRGMTGLFAFTGAIALTIVTASGASAATQVNPDGASITAHQNSAVAVDSVDGSALEGVASGQITVDGSGFAPTPRSLIAPRGVGIYVVYGPKRADFNTNAAVYNSAEWLRSGSGTFTGSAFTGATADIAATYVSPQTPRGGGVAVDCRYDYDQSPEWNAANEREKCYIQTMTAHGRFPSSPASPTANDVALEVRW